MTSSTNHQLFGSHPRRSQTLSNDRCQTILYKEIFEHFEELQHIATLLLTSKSFQNSSFGANFVLNYAVDFYSIDLLESVLSPSSCFSLQFVPSLHIIQSEDDSEQSERLITKFVGELVNTKYLPSSLRSLTLDKVKVELVWLFFGNSTGNSWPQLQDLSVIDCGLSDTVLALIANSAAQLRTIDLSGNWEITETGLEHLSNLANITSLNLSGGGSTTDSGLEHVAKLSGITNLNLCGCYAITDAGLETISELSNITSLDLSLCSNINDDGIEHLAKLSGITYLNLGNCRRIADISLEHVVKLVMITTLDLSNCNFTDVGLRTLSALPDITSLNLADCNEITDAGIECIAKLSSINSLILARCFRITDAGVQYACQLPSITSLDLRSCCEITDAGVEHLANLSKITYLNLYNCANITCKAKQMLETALPNCGYIR